MTAWLSRLKNEKSGGTHATKPAKPPSGDSEVGFVGFVASLRAPCDKFDQEQTRPFTQAVNDAVTKFTEADHWGGLHSQTIDAREIEVFKARVVRFTERGVCHNEAESLADKLAIRDREQDERHCCLECSGLQGKDFWCCTNWQRAQVPRSGLPRDFVKQLQRCPGFKLRTQRCETCG